MITLPTIGKDGDAEWWFIFAQGPSFLREDAEKLRPFGKTMGINNAVFYCPWIDVLYACDGKWWREYEKKIPKLFKGEKYSYQRVPGCERFYRQKNFPSMGGNGGQQGIQLAYSKRNPEKEMWIGLLGFDHQHTGGKKHCHKDHPRPMGNAGSVMNWPGVMEKTAEVLKRKKVTVINFTRETAIDCFPRMEVDELVSHYRNS